MPTIVKTPSGTWKAVIRKIVEADRKLSKNLG